jgi:uncharacterized protein
VDCTDAFAQEVSPVSQPRPTFVVQKLALLICGVLSELPAIRITLHSNQYFAFPSDAFYNFAVNILSEVEARVLGSLVEKELTTPEYYPLSLNALVNSCNQKSNRDPAMNLDETVVSEVLRTLDKEGLAGRADGMVNRVTKFEHRLQEAFNFDRREISILCELLLRGPQTPGELRSRAERMHPFDDLAQVQSTLQRLAQREPPVVKMLSRAPGTKEARYAHLLSGDVPEDAQAHASRTSPQAAVAHSPADGERISRLENRVAVLQNEVGDLKQQLAAFRKQFE